MADETDRAAGLDVHDGIAPLADLLFAVATVVIALLVAVLPTLVTAPAAERTRAATIEAVAARTGAPLVLIADGDGVLVSDRTVSPPADRTVATSALLDDRALAATLARAAGAGVPPAVAIEDTGSEAAFVLEGLLAAAGVTAVRQLRLPSSLEPSP